MKKIQKYFLDFLYLGLILVIGIFVGANLKPFQSDYRFGGSNNLHGDLPSPEEYSWDSLEEQVIYMPESKVPPVWEKGSKDAAKQINVFLDLQCPYSAEYIKTDLPVLLNAEDARIRLYLFSRDEVEPGEVFAASVAKCVARNNPDGFANFLKEYIAVENPTDLSALLIGMITGRFENKKAVEDCAYMNYAATKEEFDVYRSVGVDISPITNINRRSFLGSISPEHLKKLLETAGPWDWK